MQAQYAKDGLQVYGVCRWQGHRMDFVEGSPRPNGGKNVGSGKDGRLNETAETVLLLHFADAFKMNYPIVVTAPEVCSKLYTTFAIPVLFVIDREGKVAAVLSSATEEQIEAAVKKALAE